MVDSILLLVAVVSIAVWFIQEKFARSAMQKNLDQVIASDQVMPADQLQSSLQPSWNDTLFKLVSLIWLGWVASVFLIKDGDFAFVLVILTLLSGLITGLDKLLFDTARRAYCSSKSVVDYLAKYTEEQREALSHTIKQDMIVGEYAKSFFPVLAVVLILRSFIVEPFQIPSASMVPTLLVGDYILVNKFTYGLRLPVLGTKIVEMGEPERGDVMVFFPPHKDIYFIKRVIGLPGDQITFKNKTLFINGKMAPQTLLAELPPAKPQVDLVSEQLSEVEHLVYNTKGVQHKSEYTDFRGDFSITVKPGHYWMMGDNRDNSSDSRAWGMVPEENIVGKAFAVWMHWPGLTQLPSFSRVGAIQ